MNSVIIIIICSLLLIAYLFDISSSRTKIPSVILLLLMGWVARQVTIALNLQAPVLDAWLPVFGTIGFILIVLEGALEIEFNRSKIKIIRKSVFSALFPILGLSFLFAFGFYQYGHFAFRNCLINAIPLSVISSAIAIPSVKYLRRADKEFVIYESSFSDIFGVLFFNFVLLNNSITAPALWYFGLQLILIFLISFLATFGLSFLLRKIDHHIKFGPIIILVILIYEVSKLFNLPALVFIVLFGLFLGNLDKMDNVKWIKKAKPEILNKEVHKFKEFVVEGAFLIRSMFFIIFGFLLDTAEILNQNTFLLAVEITCAIFLFRLIQLKIYRLRLLPLMFIAPRGLITILLFLSVSTEHLITPVNKSLIIQVIVLTAMVMMTGLMVTKRDKEPFA